MQTQRYLIVDRSNRLMAVADFPLAAEAMAGFRRGACIADVGSMSRAKRNRLAAILLQNPDRHSRGAS